MTRSKKVEPALQVAGAVQNAMAILAGRVGAAFGGNFTEALVRLGTGEKRYGVEYQQLADILTGISIAPEGGRVRILRDVVVDESVKWISATETSCPDTPTHYAVFLEE